MKRRPAYGREDARLIAHRSLRIVFRRTFTALNVLSVILCLATATLWMRSHWKRDIAMLSRPTALWAFESWGGVLTVERTNDAAISAVNPSGRFAFDAPVDFAFTPHGFYYGGLPGLIGLITLPHWSVAVLFALLPTYSTISYIRHRKLRPPGHCRACGYDLRATPDRCPECGCEDKK